MNRFLIISLTLLCFIICSAYFYTPTVYSKTSLGKKLFFDTILSKDYTISCASCHKPAFAFADTAALSTGIYGKLTSRNTPSVLNMKSRPYFFWDGRAASLATQALMPISHPNEMGLPIKEAVQRLNNNSQYRNLFYKVFKQPPNATNLSNALQAYEQSLETSGSKMDESFDDTTLLSATEERGRKLFVGDKAKCFDCHFTPDYTGDEFRNIGLFNGSTLTDKGRYEVTKNKGDIGKFKTPGLRNIALTAPYMHNGMFATLEAVVDYYNDPKKFVPNPINVDTLLAKPLGLTQQEKSDLVAFLKTLTDKPIK